MHYEEAIKHCIFRFISGSQQYGTNRPESDIDYRGVFIAPFNNFFELFRNKTIGEGTIEQNLRAAIDSIKNENFNEAKNLIDLALQKDKGDLSIGVETVSRKDQDEEIHELRKFLKLAADCNPSIIEFLYIEDLIQLETPIWKKIKAKRDMFLSKKARFTFAGYATEQLRRIRVHRKYLLDPPTHQPTRKEFDLPECSKIQPEHQGSILSLPDQWLSDDAKACVVNERKYRDALVQWNSYKKWEKERNPARKEIERKFGFDVKHSLHLVRLVRMCKEILRDGVVLVRRPDAEELKGILRGEWTYDQVVKEAEDLNNEMDSLYQVSTLREKPDLRCISDLYKEICEEVYNINLK